MKAFLSRAWRQQPQYPVDPNPEWRVAFNAATSPQSTDSTGVHWRLQGTTNDWLARARVALPPHGIAFQAEQFYGGDDSISGVHSGGAGYLFPREQGTMVVLGKVVTPFAYQPAIAVSNGALLRGDIDETWFQVGGNIWTTGQAWSTTMDGLFAVALTWGAFGRRLYRGGRLLASTSTAPSSTAHSGTLNVGGDGMRYWMCAISGDVLDAGALSENPWQVFRPRTARIYSFPSGAAGTTGDANITEAEDTASAAGTVEVTGAASGTDDGDTVTAAGAVAIDGTATPTEGDDSASAAGAVEVTGAAAVTEGDDTLSAAGTVAAGGGVAGEAEIVEADDTAAAAGTVAVDAAASLTEGDDAGAAAGNVAVEGAAALSEEADAVAASGNVGSGGPEITGAAAITEDADTVAAAGTVEDQVFPIEDPFWLYRDQDRALNDMSFPHTGRSSDMIKLFQRFRRRA